MEALILRRNYPVPVTFADLRRAALDDTRRPFWGHPWACVERLGSDRGLALIRRWWHAALKSATGATDDVYAVVDGREVFVTRAPYDEVFVGTSRVHSRIADLLVKADEQGYWERPHEVRLDLQERSPSLKAIDAVVQRSLIEAEVRR